MSEEQLKKLGKFHYEWSLKAGANATLDSNYAYKDKSQYPETMVDLSCSADDETAFWRGVAEIYGESKMPVNAKAVEAFLAKAGRNAIDIALDKLDEIPPTVPGHPGPPERRDRDGFARGPHDPG